ncbi:MAG: glycosyltransferase [Paracoccaceae bacterium]|nr:glycosyltransferase [Paracoccaceae bacterium]
MTAPALSVVIPAWNRARTIRAAIESVLSQEVADVEVIVVDDGSDDGTAAAARGVGDARVRVLEQGRNGGAAAARNAGVAEARAPWIAFQDSDDRWLPGKLAAQMARLAEPRGWIACYCGMALVGAGPGGRTRLSYIPDPRHATVEGDLAAALLMTSLISTQTLVASKDALEAVGGFDESLPALEDWDLAIRLARHGPIAFVDKPLVLQSFSENSITRNSRRLVEARALIFQKHRASLAEHPQALARNARVLAGGWRDLGEPRKARAVLADATAALPFDPGLRLAALSLRLPRRR